MRKALILLPLLLAGCKAGRHSAVSNDGRVASSAEGGTYVAGVGKVGPEADDLVFSPDGQSLAFSSKGGVTLWPWNVRVAGMEAPLAFSPDGDRLAGVFERHVRIKDLRTGTVQPTTFTEWPDGLRWTADGRLIAFFGRQVAVDGGRTLQLKDGDLLDVRPTLDGSVTFLSIEPEQAPGTDPREGTLIRWRWDPDSGKLRRESSTPIADFTVRTPGRLDLPYRYALSPDGERCAAALLRIETTPERLARMWALGSKPHLTSFERSQLERLLQEARQTSVVETLSDNGRAKVLWSAPTDESHSVTDFDFSADGHWLAIAGKKGTARVRVE